MLRAAVAVGRAKARQPITALPVLCNLERRGRRAATAARFSRCSGRATCGSSDVVRINAVSRSGNKVAAGSDRGVGAQELGYGDARDLG
jgi:hypothetical protein